jgi:putative ABC transport system permease protein
MSTRAWLRIVGQNLRRARRQFVVSAIGIAIGVGALGFFLALSAGVREVVLGQVFHIDRVELEPPRSTIDLPLLGGGPRLIDDQQVTRLRALPGVKRVAPRMRLHFPARAWGGAQFLGRDRYAELIGEGLDPAAVAGENFSPVPFADLEEGRQHERCNADPDCHTQGEYCAWDVHECQKPVPVVISRFLVELYNGSFAGSHGLPKINDFIASRFRGFTFTIELGASFLGARAVQGTPRQRRAMLVGVSDHAVPIGVSVPLGYVKRWNAEYAGAKGGSGYTSVTVEVGDKGAVTSVVAAARELGLGVGDSAAEQAGLAITLMTLLLGLASLAILAVAVINIVHMFYRVVSERRREIGVLRALGASASDVRRILLGEAAAIGLLGGVVGVLFAYLLSRGVDVAVARWVPDFPFKPESFFIFSAALVVGCLGFAVVACLGGALWPARSAARLDPAAALAAV